MSKNKGKDGEMRVLKLLADVAVTDDKGEVLRLTGTNTADRGGDLILESVGKTFLDLATTASPEQRAVIEAVIAPQEKMSARIDVKTTNNKITSDIVDDFAHNVKKNPNDKGQVLMGGRDLTGPAKKKFSEYQKLFVPNGKALLYISNEGLEKLEGRYAVNPSSIKNENEK
jgi:hypothetical protein